MTRTIAQPEEPQFVCGLVLWAAGLCLGCAGELVEELQAATVSGIATAAPTARTAPADA